MEPPIRKSRRDAIVSHAWAMLFVILAVAGAFLISSSPAVGYASWAVGIGIFVALVYLRAKAEVSWRQRKLRQHLASLPPEERLAALDKYYGGALSSAMNTPEYRQAERAVRSKIERDIGPILNRLDQLANAKSFSAQNQVDEQLKKLRQALADARTETPSSTPSRRTKPDR